MRALLDPKDSGQVIPPRTDRLDHLQQIIITVHFLDISSDWRESVTWLRLGRWLANILPLAQRTKTLTMLIAPSIQLTEGQVWAQEPFCMVAKSSEPSLSLRAVLSVIEQLLLLHTAVVPLIHKEDNQGGQVSSQAGRQASNAMKESASYV